jgi:hypothetical protein
MKSEIFSWVSPEAGALFMVMFLGFRDFVVRSLLFPPSPGFLLGFVIIIPIEVVLTGQ